MPKLIWNWIERIQIAQRKAYAYYCLMWRVHPKLFVIATAEYAWNMFKLFRPLTNTTGCAEIVHCDEIDIQHFRTCVQRYRNQMHYAEYERSTYAVECCAVTNFVHCVYRINALSHIVETGCTITEKSADCLYLTLERCILLLMSVIACQWNG